MSVDVVKPFEEASSGSVGVVESSEDREAGLSRQIIGEIKLEGPVFYIKYLMGMGNMREYETQRGTKYTTTTNIKKGANQSAKLVDVTRVASIGLATLGMTTSGAWWHPARRTSKARSITPHGIFHEGRWWGDMS